MKIIYDNIIFSLQKAGGISMYWSELIKRSDTKYSFFGFKNKNIFAKKISIEEGSESKIPVGILRYLPFMKKLPENSIFHSSYYRVSLQSGIKNVTTVHDFTYEKYETGLKRFVHVCQKGFALRRSDGIICVSKNTKMDLLKYYPKLASRKIKVIYEAANEDFVNIKDTFTPSRFFNLGKRFILFVGSRVHYKNFNVVVSALQNSGYELVIVGGGELDRREKKLLGENLTGCYHHFIGINSKELNWLYNNAFCFMYPSSYEGFGIPILEAMQSGCPVISTKISSIPEVAGDAALLLDNVDESSLRNAVNKMKDTNTRNSLVQKGLEQAKKFSWDKCHKETEDFYLEI